MSSRSPMIRSLVAVRRRAALMTVLLTVFAGLWGGLPLLADTDSASAAPSEETSAVPLTRINQFTAKAGSGDALYALIESFLLHIRESDGCIEARLLRDVDDADRVLVIEVWRDKESHRASAANVPPGTFEKAMALMAGPPSGAYYRE